jgi:alpha-tubulin suppressor-like RCC1 family protein
MGFVRSRQFYFSAFGSVYVWGSGIDGQLGLGDKVLFLSTPKRLKDQNLQRKVTYIAAGESYSEIKLHIPQHQFYGL